MPGPQPTTPHSNPIRRLTVDSLLPLPDGSGSLIEWFVDQSFCTTPLDYVVLYANHPKGPFKKIGQTTDNRFIDTAERRTGYNTEIYYTVMAREPVTGQVFKGPIQRVGSVWQNREWRLAREILRQEQVRLVRGHAGTRGYLLSRRNAGEKCPCTGTDTGSLYDPNCATCYGTGFVGGYYPPLFTHVDQNPERVQRRILPDQGMVTKVVSTWRVQAYPAFRANDVWVNAATNERWRIGSDVATLAHMRGVPLIKQVSVNQLEFNDPVYHFEVGDDG